MAAKNFAAAALYTTAVTDAELTAIPESLALAACQPAPELVE
jgi:hypothetical protein